MESLHSDIAKRVDDGITGANGAAFEYALILPLCKHPTNVFPPLGMPDAPDTDVEVLLLLATDRNTPGPCMSPSPYGLVLGACDDADE